jgi:acetyl esterase/lipase
MPVPDTISRQARDAIAPMLAAAPPADLPPIDQMRMFADAVQQHLGNAQLERNGVSLGEAVVGGVPVRLFAAASSEPAAVDGTGAVLLNFHGGGFVVDSGSMTENIPLAAKTGLPVVSALYRLAPEHPFPAAVDDALMVYRALLANRRPEQIGVFGTSAGAGLATQLLARLKAEGLPLPGALGFFSGSADVARDGDIETLLPKLPSGSLAASLGDYVGDTPRDLPLISPIFSDLRGFPPTLILSSTRDQLLSHSAMFHRALLKAEVAADLVVFEALPHAFWSYIEAPETDEAFDFMARFFLQALRDD